MTRSRRGTASMVRTTLNGPSASRRRSPARSGSNTAARPSQNRYSRQEWDVIQGRERLSSPRIDERKERDDEKYKASCSGLGAGARLSRVPGRPARLLGL